MKLKKSTLIASVAIIVLILMISILFLNTGKKDSSEITKNFASCLGENSIIYVQEGCSACAIQEEMFGDYYNELNSVDCVYHPQECNKAGITATPTWIINGQKYIGVQYPDRLSEVSGCSLE